MREGKLVLLLSDRYLVRGRMPAHALLVTGAVHHHLVKTGLRCKCNLLVETGTAREPHHFACLIGYGATAVYPYMAYQVLFEMMRKGHVKLDFAARLELGRSYRAGLRKGLFKIMSKMGISTIGSYRSSQLFEIVGLADEVVERCFTGTPSRVRGADFADLEADARTLAAQAWNPRESIGQGGLLKYVHGGEYHMYNPDVIAALQAAVVTGDVAHYRQFARLVNERPPSTFRDLLALTPRRSAGAARRGRAGSRDPRALRQRRHVARGAVARGARGAGDRHEPARGALQLRRGRRGSRRATAPRRTPRSSRWPRDASASPPST